MEDRIYAYLYSGKPEILYNRLSIDIHQFKGDRAWGWLHQSEVCVKMLNSLNLAPSSIQRLPGAMAEPIIRQKHESAAFSRPVPLAPPDSTRRECR